MSRKNVLLSMSILVLLAVGMAFTFQSKVPDMPLGNPEDSWISLSENAGILLSHDRKAVGSDHSEIHGTIYIKRNSVWKRVYLEPGPAEFIPLVK
jgi:hypothetical protein